MSDLTFISVDFTIGMEINAPLFLIPQVITLCVVYLINHGKTPVKFTYLVREFMGGFSSAVVDNYLVLVGWLFQFMIGGSDLTKFIGRNINFGAGIPLKFACLVREFLGGVFCALIMGVGLTKTSILTKSSIVLNNYYIFGAGTPLEFTCFVRELWRGAYYASNIEDARLIGFQFLIGGNLPKSFNLFKIRAISVKVVLVPKRVDVLKPEKIVKPLVLKTAYGEFTRPEK